MRRGIVFTMDSVFALLLTVLVMTTIITILEILPQSTDDSLQLSRIARDYYDVTYYNADAQPPAWLKQGGNCTDSGLVSTAYGVYYADNGELEEKMVKVCYNE